MTKQTRMTSLGTEFTALQGRCRSSFGFHRVFRNSSFRPDLPYPFIPVVAMPSMNER
jgi:hypothetical protein